jgi:hypothetical protein
MTRIAVTVRLLICTTVISCGLPEEACVAPVERTGEAIDDIGDMATGDFENNEHDDGIYVFLWRSACSAASPQ